MVLLVIDTQNLIVTETLYAFDSFVKNVADLLRAARKGGTEVIFVRHSDEELMPGTPGFDIYPAFAPKPGEKIFDKHFNSAFRETGLAEYLLAEGQTELMTVGLQTDYCIDATVKSGFERGFRMIVPAFCNTTEDNDFLTGESSYRYYNEEIWRDRYASCIPLEDAKNLLS